jgi:hypothetical protein
VIRFASLVLSILLLASGTALCADPAEGHLTIDDKSIKDVPEPIKCYSFMGDITGDEKMPVGLAVQLCAGTKNAKATLVCYKSAVTLLQLSRGLAIELCSEGGKLH